MFIYFYFVFYLPQSYGLRKSETLKGKKPRLDFFWIVRLRALELNKISKLKFVFYSLILVVCLILMNCLK